ncbi:hypothetical protein [Paenibacillus sp. 1781tsa1]|uniref:hypothetical protein n=1 Tax=Paenibacillus sp. 1781tsa1 TaxID=2953810 RepID=UPI00209C89B0|nr:hypothetical protein [Paenibacillus sp. 1781tsa1]MCP1185000.1 hypothetical protein [Paenibacillus sp. 1781tsa1]
MNIKRSIAMFALSLAMISSFLPNATQASPTTTDQDRVTVKLAVKPMTVLTYFNVGDGVPPFWIYNQDGWYGTLPLVSYDIANGVVYARYQGNVYQ